MKLRILAAASALAIAGAAYAVYRETRPDTAATAADTPTPVERAARSPATSRPDEPTLAREQSAMPTEASATSPSDTSAARTSAPPAPALPVPAGARRTRDTAALTSSLAQQPVGSAATTRRGATSIKLRPGTRPLDPRSPDAVRAQQKSMNRTLESAACHAPDLEQRYLRLPENERTALRARCAKYGVKLTDPS